MASPADHAAAIAAAAQSISHARSLSATLQTIAEVARDSIPGFDHVGIATIEQGHVETRAAAGDLVLPLDKIQYGLGEGPCVDTLGQSHIVVAPRIRHEQR